jgi:hypothetical protein
MFLVDVVDGASIPCGRDHAFMRQIRAAEEAQAAKTDKEWVTRLAASPCCRVALERAAKAWEERGYLEAVTVAGWLRARAKEVDDD